MFQVPKKKRLFYNAEDDLHLLREVVGQNPFTDQARWQKIKENLLEATGKDFSLRSVKDRVTLLADQFAAKAATDQYKSGVEEDVTEKDDLLHSIILLIKDFKNKSKKVVRSQYQKGYDKRELAHNEILMSSNKENVLDNNEEIISQNEIEYIVVDDEDSRTLNLDLEQNNSSLEECMPNSSPKTTSKKIEKGNAKACGTPARVRTGGLKQTSIRYLEKKIPDGMK